VPPALLALRIVLMRFVQPIDRVGPLLGALGTAALWTLYFIVLKRLSFGWRATWQGAATTLRRSSVDVAELVQPALTGAVIFLALEYTGCFGGLLLSAAAVSPVIELIALRDLSPPEALGRGFTFLKDRPFVWSALQLGLLTLATFIWALVTTPFSIALSFLSEEHVWVAGFVGALTVGPLLHLMFVFRGVLFLEVERTTHAQRVFRAKQGSLA
jgi:hypothetical protein